MSKKTIYIVVQDLSNKEIGGNIIYMGYDREKAVIHYMNTAKSDWFQFHQIDSSVIEEE